MVYVNSKKFACEACIKGHRSSGCHHNDRPLYEIKKKGRPVSQCMNCRQARQSSGVHCKCTCDLANSTPPPIAEGEKKKGRRFVPQPPSLPNGLKDALETTEMRAKPKQQSAMNALLNPCHCADFYNCKCGTSNVEASGSRIENSTNRQQALSSLAAGGLSTLALVAACCSSPSASSLLSLSSLTSVKDVPMQEKTLAVGSSSSNSASTFTTSVPAEQSAAGPSKRKRPSNSPPATSAELPAVQLPRSKQFRPIAPALTVDTLADKPMRYSFSLPPIPTAMASTSASEDVNKASQSAADSDPCCCGTRCECSGCSLHGEVESNGAGAVGHWVHEGASSPTVVHLPRRAHSAYPSTSAHRVSCGDNCPTCIDYVGGIELPPILSIPGVATPSSASSSSARGPHQSSFLDAFFARAASLPTPPPSSARSTLLDPTNVVVYPRGLFTPPASSGSIAVAGPSDDPRRAFGLISVPKLEECCGGRCGCMEGACSCGDACGGCCMGEDANTTEITASKGKDKAKSPVLLESENRSGLLSPSISFARQSPATRGGCCSR